MKISGTDMAGSQAGAALGMGAGEDAQTKSIRKQIANVQKQLQELSSNEEISVEEKMKKRQELQKQLTELNGQLRQHQIELRRKASETEKQKQESNTAKKQSDPAADMVLSADAALKQAKVQDRVASALEGRVGVLKAEIKTDGDRGVSTEAKQEELADVEGRITDVRDAQAKQLSSANKEIAGGKETDKTSQTQKEEKEKADKEEKENREEDRKEEEISKKEEITSKYKPINILL